MIRTLLIGYGNTLRRDDGAGVLAASMVSRHCSELDCVTVQQLQLEVVDIMSRYDCVIFVDAALDSDRVQLTPLDPTSCGQILQSHDLSPQILVNVCRTLYGPVPTFNFLVRIPAYDIGFGETLSAKCSEKTHECVEMIVKIVRGGARGFEKQLSNSAGIRKRVDPAVLAETGFGIV
jgi:hydrogenase maturation protease